MRKNEGFLQIIILIVIALVVAAFFGYGPQTLWNDYLAPAILYVWGILVVIVEFIVSLVSSIIGGIQKISNIIHR